MKKWLEVASVMHNGKNCGYFLSDLNGGLLIRQCRWLGSSSQDRSLKIW